MKAYLRALVDTIVAAGKERNGQRCPCKCNCNVKLTMPSEWQQNLCIFCRTGEHAGQTKVKA